MTKAKHPQWITIPAGAFNMGSADSPYPEDGEGPVRRVTLDAFTISACVVSNAEFAAFVAVTGYVTDAERRGYSFVFRPEMPSPQPLTGGDSKTKYACLPSPLCGGKGRGWGDKRLSKSRTSNIVPTSPPIPSPSPTREGKEKRLLHAPWWAEIPNAYWQQPYDDNRTADPDLPVVHVSHNDALAYCHWAQCRLPTEAEWEYAARGGLEDKIFPWGDELEPDGKHRSNVWQGEFPQHNTAADGYAELAPVNSFQPNGYGLYNMTGNVWEWCADRFSRLHGPQPLTNPKGPLSGSKFVQKGGSFLCHHSYCMRYRVAARTCNLPNATAANAGFRVVK